MHWRARGFGDKESRKVGGYERWGANSEGPEGSGTSMGTPRQKKGLETTMSLIAAAWMSLEQANPEPP